MVDAQPTPRDATFSELAAYGSTAWVATVLGWSVTWFRNQRDHLTKEHGFPKPDAVTGHLLKDDVYAWINRRRQISDATTAAPTTESPARINHEAL